jgi:hypothetical protein
VGVSWRGEQDVDWRADKRTAVHAGYRLFCY